MGLTTTKPFAGRHDRWQIVTEDSRTGKLMSTVELPAVISWPLGYGYETALFLPHGDSEVLERYDTMEAAELGHERHVREHLTVPAVDGDTGRG